MIGNYLQMIAAGTAHPSFPESRFAGETGGRDFLNEKMYVGVAFPGSGDPAEYRPTQLRLSI